jgi:hypothetical protein
MLALEFAGAFGGGLCAEYDRAVQRELIAATVSGSGVWLAVQASMTRRFSQRRAVMACAAWPAAGPVVVSVT